MLPGCAARTHEAAGRRACVGGVASWRPLSGRLAPPRRGCAVTSLAGQDRQTLSNMPSAIRRRRIEFNPRMQLSALRAAADTARYAADARGLAEDAPEPPATRRWSADRGQAIMAADALRDRWGDHADRDDRGGQEDP